MPTPRQLQNVPDSEVEGIVADLVSERFEVTKQRQPDGRWTIIAVKAAPAAASPPPPRPARPAPAPQRPPAPQPSAPPRAAPAGGSSGLTLAPANERYRPFLVAAAARCGLAPAALAALVDAEAGKDAAGGWDPRSANPRSSARGLTQFLDATWTGVACRAGSHLNGAARARGLLGDDGKVAAGREQELLDLRFDPECCIHAAADYARHNLAFLEQQGCVPPGASDDERARLAYLAHHEGAEGARRFLRREIPEDRAEELLTTNAGAARAAALRRDHASWQDAYVAFLTAYIDRKIRPAAFR